MPIRRETLYQFTADVYPNLAEWELLDARENARALAKLLGISFLYYGQPLDTRCATVDLLNLKWSSP